MINSLNSEVVHLRDKEDIEGAIIEYLPELFLCADGTPLRTPSMVVEFFYMGDTVAGDAVISGTYSPLDNIDEYTKLLLKFLKRLDQLHGNTIKSKCSTSDYVS